MKAIVVESFGPAEIRPKLHSIKSPIPGVGEVLVDVHAAGLNFADLLVIEGKYQSLPTLPFVPGKEFAGVVAAVGVSETHAARLPTSGSGEAA
jgi:NADPH2:quinone reductase